MSRHLADQRTPTTGGRVKAFMQIAHQKREGIRPEWHRTHYDRDESPSRLQHFLRIARGHKA